MNRNLPIEAPCRSLKRKKKREKDRTMVITMAKLCMAHGWRTQAAWANTLETGGGPGGRDQTLAVKIRKNARKKYKYYPPIFFCIYLLVMPKHWGKQIFSLGSFPEVGQQQKTERKKEKEGKWVIKMASYTLQRRLGWRTQSRLGQQIGQSWVQLLD